MSVCKKCGAPLSVDDVGAYRKLVNRDAEAFLCVPCLARELNVSEGYVREKIAQFKRQGCTLFGA